MPEYPPNNCNQEMLSKEEHLSGLHNVVALEEETEKWIKFLGCFGYKRIQK